AATDEPAQLRVTASIDGQRDELQATFQAEFGADEEFDLQELRGHVRADDAGDRTFIRDGDRAVVESMGAFHQFLGMRSAAEEGEVAEAVQLSVLHPKTPCRNQR